MEKTVVLAMHKLGHALFCRDARSGLERAHGGFSGASLRIGDNAYEPWTKIGPTSAVMEITLGRTRVLVSAKIGQKSRF